MPTYPKSENQSSTTSGAIREVHSLNSKVLADSGWDFTVTEQTIKVNTYTKNGKTIIYRFGKWFQDNREIQFVEDIQ